MAGGGIGKGRLEAFSDGVLAVIITIMVLELRPPEVASVPALIGLWPPFAIYLVSFLFLAVFELLLRHAVRYLQCLRRKVIIVI